MENNNTSMPECFCLSFFYLYSHKAYCIVIEFYYTLIAYRSHAARSSTNDQSSDFITHSSANSFQCIMAYEANSEHIVKCDCILHCCSYCFPNDGRKTVIFMTRCEYF